jgi:rubrerythrin
MLLSQPNQERRETVMSQEQKTPSKVSSASEQERATIALSRRALLGAGALAGAGIVLAGSAHADILRSVKGFIHLNPIVLNFAFEMEELESDFFARATQSNAYKDLPLRARSAINQIAFDDQEHFEALKELRAQTGNKRATNFESPNTSSSRLPRFYNYPGKAFSSTEGLLSTAIDIKQTVLQAYHGAVDLVDKDTLKLAAAIAGVEGRHLAILLEIAGQDPVPSPFEGALSSQKAGQILGRYGFAGGASRGSNNVLR